LRGEGQGGGDPRIGTLVADGLVDPLDHRRGLRQDLVIPESKHPITFPFEQVRTLLVSVLLLRMLAAIDLDHELRTQTREVHDVRADGLLPPELPTLDLASAQLLPQPLLGVSHVPPELAPGRVLEGPGFAVVRCHSEFIVPAWPPPS